MFKSIRVLIHPLLACATGLATISSQAAPVEVANSWMARFSTMKGDDSCAYGDADCNKCVSNVIAAFSDMNSPRTFSYRYDLGDKYPPSQKKPRDYLTRFPGGGGHLQSFSRIPIDKNSDKAWFAGTYGGEEAVIFIADASTESKGGRVDGDGALRYLYKAKGRHPGGSQALGHYFLVGRSNDETGFVDIYNMSNPASAKVVSFDTKVENSSVAAAKLAGGGYLLVSKDSGLTNGSYTVFFGTSLNSAKWEAVGKMKAGIGVENISLVTECGSRKLYLISATATGLSGARPTEWVYRENVYTLMSLTMAEGKPTLDIIKKDDDEEQGALCDARASGTHFVDKNGHLRRYCSQKLGTRFRESVSTCLLPSAPDYSECSGIFDKDCYTAVLKTLLPGVPTGIECTDYLQLDDHMSFTER